MSDDIDVDEDPQGFSEVKLSVNQDKKTTKKESYSKVSTFDEISEAIDNSISSNDLAEEGTPTIIDNLPFVACAQKMSMTRLGTTRAFFFNSNGDPLLIIGPDWCFFISLNTFITIIFLSFMLFFGPYMDMINLIVGWFIYGLFTVSYNYTCLINPGYPKITKDSLEGAPGLVYCKKCKLWVGKKVTHCSECEICIEGYDHHCPWTGHCVGKNNICSFFTFLFSIVLIFFYFTVSFVFALEKFAQSKKVRPVEIGKL